MNLLELDIRPERTEDAATVCALVTAAFGTDDDTADFVEAVRREAEVCLAEVAVAGGVIVGHAQWCGALRLSRGHIAGRSSRGS
jgi:predicted N-acetyltransferase YhbS